MSFTQKFLAALTIAVLAFVLVIGTLISSGLGGFVANRNSGSAAQFVQSLLTPRIQSLTTGALSAEDRASLEALTNTWMDRENLLAVTVWSPAGDVVFSTETDLIGQTEVEPNLDRPLKGEIASYYQDDAEPHDMVENRFNQPFFEVYVPLRSLVTDEVIGVGEFLEDATADRNVLASYARQNWQYLIVGGALMWLTLLAFIWQIGRMIEAQRATLARLSRDREAATETMHRLTDDIADAERRLHEVSDLVRRRVGQELHDGPVQLIAYLRILLDNLLADRDEGAGNGEDGDDMRVAANLVQDQLRQISNRLLMTDSADATDLAEIIARYEARSGVAVQTQGLHLAQHVPAVKQKAISRIVDEALNNGFKHAAGQGQAVDLHITDGDMVIDITDSGPGMPDCDALARIAQSGHHGLTGMHAQAALIGGRLQVMNRPQRGTIVSLTLSATD